MPPKTKKPKPASAASNARLLPKNGGAVVRMYRIGHGDCFLLAFTGQSPDQPVYVLIDCGYKPGSPDKMVPPRVKNAQNITANIREATGGTIDVAIITHEHQDHVNGITEANFKGINIKETWFAWTEDPKDDVANALRAKFKDKLLGLANARQRLAAAGDDYAAKKDAATIADFLEFELGGDEETPFNVNAVAGALGAAGQPVSMNKKSMKIFKDRAGKVKFLLPHKEIYALPGAKNTRVFALGPPRDDQQIIDVDPLHNEEFHSMGAASAVSYFASAFTHGNKSPFDEAYCIAEKDAFDDKEYGNFFSRNYGRDDNSPEPKQGDTSPVAATKFSTNEVPGDAPWRRINGEWLYSALQLAIDVNNATNNTSLALAFELGKGGKVLLFAADAQRGNWVSWTGDEWKDGDKQVSAKELLGRTVLYKVGHHGSHNATLNGSLSDKHPNLNWMAQGEHAAEFTAMITAVRAWAETQKGWDHPLKAIKDALLKKCSGRVFQTDTDVKAMKMGDGEPVGNWKKFMDRVEPSPDGIYFDYHIEV